MTEKLQQEIVDGLFCRKTDGTKLQKPLGVSCNRSQLNLFSPKGCGSIEHLSVHYHYVWKDRKKGSSFQWQSTVFISDPQIKYSKLMLWERVPHFRPLYTKETDIVPSLICYKSSCLITSVYRFGRNIRTVVSESSLNVRRIDSPKCVFSSWAYRSV